jgi:hypothetical protein
MANQIVIDSKKFLFKSFVKSLSFNPNFISDAKKAIVWYVYWRNWSIVRYRKLNKYVNSADEFQKLH